MLEVFHVSIKLWDIARKFISNVQSHLTSGAFGHIAAAVTRLFCLFSFTRRCWTSNLGSFCRFFWTFGLFGSVLSLSPRPEVCQLPLHRCDLLTVAPAVKSTSMFCTLQSGYKLTGHWPQTLVGKPPNLPTGELNVVYFYLDVIHMTEKTIFFSSSLSQPFVYNCLWLVSRRRKLCRQGIAIVAKAAVPESSLRVC